MKLFNREHYEANEPVALTFYTRELGKFVIEGAYMDVEPLYNRVQRDYSF